LSKHLVLATGNPHKVDELSALLTDWLILPKPVDLEVEETGVTFVENARLKALTVAQITGTWALADDSGLEVEALGGQPGVYSARWGEDDQGRIARLLGELTGVTDRRARFVCSLVLASPEGILCEVEGICQGEILTLPQGSNGFGYDPVFYYPPLGCTLAQMTSLQKSSISHRGAALRQLSLLLPALQEAYGR